MGWGWDRKPYVSVEQRREKAKHHINKRQKQGLAVQPVAIEGRKIARTFWGDSWCTHLESFSDYENRLPRGRTYVRNGSVCHLEIARGEIKALVSGSELYEVKIVIPKLPENKWKAVKEQCSGKIGSLLELLDGKLSDSVMLVVTHRREGLFPLPSEITMNCSCPDWAVMCKHVAATLYGVGARLDDKPELLFVLRGVDHEELIEADASTLITKGKEGKSKRLAEGDLGDVFGIDIFDESISVEERVKGQPKNSKAAKRAAQPAVKREKEPILKTDDLPRIKSVANNRAAAVAIDRSFTGKEIRELRKLFDMSQSEFATLIGVSTTSVSNWEKQKRLLNLQARTTSALTTIEKLTKKEARKRLNKK